MPDDAPAARPSSLRKRAAVLTAGRALFLGEGYERTSVDAVAARAGISKRTVYDYFGDKDGLFDAVITDAAAEVVDAVRAAVEEELTNGRDLREALLAFARRIASATISSSEHRQLRQLMRADRRARRSLGGFEDQPEALLAERFEELAGQGVLSATNTVRAAQHFVALTFMLALDVSSAAPAEDAEIDALLVDGVDAFLRAYHRPYP
ncbi:TetR/AcrR family transcriptional regulator [Amycolatopsis saalfeldensis]|uniref:Transcriptional regulator, TetR family n=1 Tax=Amycolatopsis saalfeldensis TaxID=394193 RepID=A0A1H8TF14_9PSEU|nr:TetR/AcrR family transcriptional regulator [Amycolatopsis saalfeldensis]SEO89517.1 transcriptional regulator, TetR family [Amycolatopsis saalfeldensis]